MFAEETIKQAWELYQASIKHSSYEKDQEKLFEENMEYQESKKIAIRNTTEEFTDLLIMLLRDYLYAVKLSSYDEFKGYCDNMAEWHEFKTERQLKRWGVINE